MTPQHGQSASISRSASHFSLGRMECEIHIPADIADGVEYGAGDEHGLVGGGSEGAEAEERQNAHQQCRTEAMQTHNVFPFQLSWV